MKRIFEAVIVFSIQLSFTLASAQSGNYFLSHHTPSITEDIDYLSFDIAQNDRGIIYVANKTGIVEFDGRNWNIIETPGAVYTMALANGNDLFLGGLTGYGKLALNEQNSYTFQSLSSGNQEARNIFASRTLGERIYFLNESNIYVVNSKTETTELTIKSNPDQSFTGIFNLGESIYVTEADGELYSLENGKLDKANLTQFAGEELLFEDRLQGTDKYLVGTNSGKIFIQENNTASELIVKEPEYLLDNVAIMGSWVNEKLIALGTLSGGVIFINTETGKTEEIINYYTGLPDNEVFAMMTDRDQGVWVSHDYGFTRIAPYLPFRTYNHYPGLSGNLLSAYSTGDQVYVGTSVGLYKLNQEEIYSEETYFVTRTKSVAKQSAESQPEVEANQKKSRKGLFGFLKKGKKSEEGAKSTDPKSEEPGSTTLREKRTRRVLQSLDFAYKRVEGIDGKVTDLMKVDGRLIAAGIGGVFEISELKARPIISEPVRALFFSVGLNQLFISTYNDRIRTLQTAESDWDETHLLDTLRGFVGNIFEDRNQNVWLCGRADVVKVEFIDGEISTISHVSFATPVLDETIGFSLGNEVFVAASGAFYRYDIINHQFTKYDSLPGPRKYFASVGTFWFNDGHRWRTVDRRLQSSMRLEWLGLFPDIRTLSLADNGDGLWLITSQNELYKFSKSDIENASRKYPLFLKQVRGPQSKLLLTNLRNINEQESALSFEFIQPEYTNVHAIEYQYMIQGISKDWSEWSSNNNVVNFPFLTPGKYKLNIKSRNLFGEISEVQSIDFNIIPPYWKRTWFYALEFVFFALLVVISVQLSVANNRYRYVSQLLSILTIIMFIELMQNAAQSLISVQTTPVVDFFIQVFIALLILPVEYRMRRFMVEASEGKYDLKKIKIGLKKQQN